MAILTGDQSLNLFLVYGLCSHISAKTICVFYTIDPYMVVHSWNVISDTTNKTTSEPKRKLTGKIVLSIRWIHKFKLRKVKNSDGEYSHLQNVYIKTIRTFKLIWFSVELWDSENMWPPTSKIMIVISNGWSWKKSEILNEKYKSFWNCLSFFRRF